MIKRIISRAICLMVSAILMIGVCGCMNASNNYPKFTIEEIIQYMSEKYGEEFTYINDIDGNQPNEYSYSIYLKAESYPEKKILAECRVADTEGVKSFSDNYDAIIYEDDVRNILTSIVNGVYPNAKVRYIVEPLISSSYVEEETKSVEEFFARNPMVSFNVLMEPGHDITKKEEEIQRLCDCLIEAKIPCSFTVRYSDDENAFENFKVNEYEPFSQKVNAFGSVKINSDYTISYIEWR